MALPTDLDHLVFTCADLDAGIAWAERTFGVRPVRGGATGDLYCRVVVETPVSLTREQKDLLKTFEASLRKDEQRHNPREHTWRTGVRSFLDKIGL